MKKTRKKLIITGTIAISVLLVLWVAARLTKTLEYYTAPTPANYPTFKIGDKFFASNLVQPKRFDFICFRARTPFEPGRPIYIFRLCGLGGDRIEIKQGNLFVNGENVDGQLSLANVYTIDARDQEKAEKAEGRKEGIIISAAGPDKMLVYLSDRNVRSGKIHAIRYVLPKEEPDEYISKQYGANWNADNFGPVTIPSGKYFVLGDNRRNAADSRYFGFIDKEDFMGTVLGHR